MNESDFKFDISNLSTLRGEMVVSRPLKKNEKLEMNYIKYQ